MLAVLSCEIMRKDFDSVMEKIGYTFKDMSLLEMALTHSSYANERKINKKSDYERLEFLGDAVLELAVSRFLFETYPDKKEGQMTKIRASLVCEPTLSGCARDIGLDKCILLGKGEEATGGRDRDSILCDVFESVAGAIYLDGGYPEAEKYIKDFLLMEWEKKILFTDSKTILQEKVQQDKSTASYRTVSEEGPANDRLYTEELLIDGVPVSRGVGTSKKSAQQKAAYEYLMQNM